MCRLSGRRCKNAEPRSMPTEKLTSWSTRRESLPNEMMAARPMLIKVAAAAARRINRSVMELQSINQNHEETGCFVTKL
jgi:hypothetical protein